MNVAFIIQVLSFFFVVAVAFGVLVLLSSLIRFNLLTHQIKAADPAQVNPIKLFELRVIQELGGLKKSPPPFCVLCILPLPSVQSELDDDTEAKALWQKEIKKSLRENDVVVSMPDGSLRVLARFTPEYADRVARRILDRIGKAALRLSSGSAVRWGACIGMAHFPENGERSSELIEGARRAAELALQSGVASYHHELPPQEATAVEAEALPPEEAGKILDPVTGVLRTERLGTALQKFVALRRKQELGVSVAYFSIDDFSAYVERYGEDATNHILKTAAEILSKQSRETDLLARAHEADFVVAMTCAPARAQIGALRLVNAIKKELIRHGRMSLRVNVSAGVAGYPDHTGHAREMFHAAGEAMLAARQNGRGLVQVYEPEQKPEAEPVHSAANF